MIKVTADTNIYISALQFAGPPRQFLNAARSQSFVLYVSQPILEEVQGVLRLKFHWEERRLEELTSQLTTFTMRVHPTESISVVEDDPDDNRVLECAVKSGSGYIVSGDNDLLRLGAYAGIRILKVAEFLPLVPLP